MSQARTLTAAASLTSALLFSGCATTKDAVLPQEGKLMQQIYEEHFERMGEHSVDRARSRLGHERRASEENLHGYVRDAQTEILATFTRLPNPTLVMFVFPHVAGTEGTPVPGYATSFPMYERMEYALPGETLDP